MTEPTPVDSLRERIKAAMDDHFAGAGNMASDEIAVEIERMEREKQK